jgi:phosphoribosylformylglycinamidine (FGAM) synthase-like enzyme
MVTGPPPALDLEREKKTLAVCLKAVREGLAASAHDCADGGLAVTLAECCIQGKIGAEIALPSEMSEIRLDAALFGESPSRIVVSADAQNAARIQELAADEGVAAHVLGTVGGEELAIAVEGRRQLALIVAEMDEIWRSAIPSLIRE